MKPKCVRRYRSRSSKDWHKVSVDEKGKVSCSCKGYTYQGKCWHVTQYKGQETERFLAELDSWLLSEIRKSFAHKKARRK